MVCDNHIAETMLNMICFTQKLSQTDFLWYQRLPIKMHLHSVYIFLLFCIFQPSDDESDVTEKPFPPPPPPASPPPPPFTPNPYVNDSARRSWRQKNQNSNNYTYNPSYNDNYNSNNDNYNSNNDNYNSNYNAYTYTDSENDSSHYALSLNSGRVIMNNAAGSRAPLPGFSSFVW